MEPSKEWKQLLALLFRLPGVWRAYRISEKLLWSARIRRLSRSGQKRVALASFPRSGNTWLRFVLETATGEQTGIATGTKSRKQARILSRGHDGIVIKTHRQDSYRYTHAIHLVRNPFDSLDSIYDYKAALKWEGMEQPPSWEEFVTRYALRWRSHTRHWLAASCDVFRIRYEDCLGDPATHFGALLRWLGRELAPQQLEEVIRQTSFDQLRSAQQSVTPVAEKFFRRGRANMGMERFSRPQRHWMVDSLKDELTACGYEDVLRLAAQ